MPAVFIAMLYLVAGILIAGVIVWALDSLPGIDADFKKVAKVVLIAILVVWVIVVLVSTLTGLLPIHWPAR